MESFQSIKKKPIFKIPFYKILRNKSNKKWCKTFIEKNYKNLLKDSEEGLNK